MRTRHDQAARRRIIEQWDKSGLSAGKFAVGAGVSAWTLYKWRRELRSGVAGFVEVVPDESAPLDGGELDPALEIVLPGGTVVRVGRDVAEALLRRIVVALASSSA